MKRSRVWCKASRVPKEERDDGVGGDPLTKHSGEMHVQIRATTGETEDRVEERGDALTAVEGHSLKQ